jgi:hypothetical protein
MQTTICIASGPSLTAEDVEYCKGKGRVYIVSDVYKLAPWADALYSCDYEWWKYHQGVPEFTGQKYTINVKAAEEFKINKVCTLEKEPWSKEQNRIVTGGNSGFQCMNLADIHGAERIILLGYDMQFGENRKRHFFGEHPKALNRNSNYKGWVENFKKAAPHIKAKVINCSRNTAIDCFEKNIITNVI